MYRKHLFFSLFLFFLTGVLTYISKIDVTEQIISDLLTVISILLGFTLTSISTLIGQDFTKRLHSKVDTDTTRMQTQLQTVSVYYKTSFLLGIIIIVCLIAIQFISNCLYIRKILFPIIFGLIADDFFISYQLVKVLIRSLIEIK